MAMQEPFYNRHETDLKIESVEQRIDHKLDRLGNQIERLTIAMEAGFQIIDSKFENIDSKMDSQFKLIDKDINWLKWLVGGVFFLLMTIMAIGGLKWFFLMH